MVCLCGVGLRGLSKVQEKEEISERGDGLPKVRGPPFGGGIIVCLCVCMCCTLEALGGL